MCPVVVVTVAPHAPSDRNGRYPAPGRFPLSVAIPTGRIRPRYLMIPDGGGDPRPHRVPTGGLPSRLKRASI